MTRLSPGATEALSDNPLCGATISALVELSQADAEAAHSEILESSVRAALLRAAARRKALRAWLSGFAAAAAAIAIVAFLRLGDAAPAPTSFVAANSTATDAAQDALSEEAVALLARQLPDGSWQPLRGGLAMSPAATGAAVLRLVMEQSSAATEALDKAAIWLRAHQLPDGTFAASRTNPWQNDVPTPRNPSAADTYNLALATSALLELYGHGERPELFNSVDSAVAAIRDRFTETTVVGDGRLESNRSRAWLASALVRAEALDWPGCDGEAGAEALRRALLGVGNASDPALAAVASASTPGDRKSALLSLPCPVGS